MRAQLITLSLSMLLALPGCIMLHARNPMRQRLQWEAVDTKLGKLDDTKASTHEGLLTQRELNTPRAALSGIFTGNLGARRSFTLHMRDVMSYVPMEYEQRELVPYQTDHEAIIDEAVLLSTQPETCVAVTLQSERSYDMAIKDLDLRWDIDGVQATAWRTVSEHTNNMMLWYKVRVYLFWTIDEVFDVMIRHAVLCAPQQARESVSLKLHNTLYPLDVRSPWTLHFIWHLKDPGLR